LAPDQINPWLPSNAEGTATPAPTLPIVGSKMISMEAAGES
jgi:hypothetical protein